MKNKIPLLIYSVLTIMTMSSILMCVFWLPCAIDYMAKFIPMTPLRWLCGIIAIPFFGILLAAFAFQRAVANDTVFSVKTAKLLLDIAIALFVDCVLLCAVSVWLLLACEALLSPVLLFISLIGITLSVLFFILARYVTRAAILKEEADATL